MYAVYVHAYVCYIYMHNTYLILTHTYIHLYIAFLFQALEEYPVAGEYLTNYHKAMDTIKACAEENEQFARLTDVQ